MDDDLTHLVDQVEACTRRHRDHTRAMAECGCATPCTWCRAVRLVAQGELLAALDRLEATETLRVQGVGGGVGEA